MAIDGLPEPDRERRGLAVADLGYLLFGIAPLMLVVLSDDWVRELLLPVRGTWYFLIAAIPILAIAVAAWAFMLEAPGYLPLAVLSLVTIPFWLLFVSYSVSHHLLDVPFVRYSGYAYVSGAPLIMLGWFTLRVRSALKEVRSKRPEP